MTSSHLTVSRVLVPSVATAVVSVTQFGYLHTDVVRTLEFTLEAGPGGCEKKSADNGGIITS